MRLRHSGTLTDAAKTQIVAASDLTANSQVVAGAVFTASANVAALNTDKNFTGKILTATGVLTSDIESVQAKINTARVQAGSQYAAIESAINYTTDLTAQYELGYNTVNDVNFQWRQRIWPKTKFFSRPQQRCSLRRTRGSRITTTDTSINLKYII